MRAKLRRQIASCTCGNVRFEAVGNPFLANACYCGDCRAAAAAIGNLPGASSPAEADGGTEYLLYRKDRIACTKGESLLVPMRLDPKSATKRLIAGCCNSAMAMAFDDSRHWVSAYRRRFENSPPPIELRICMGDARAVNSRPDNVPTFKGYPARMMFKLVGARLAMTFNKGETIDG